MVVTKSTTTDKDVKMLKQIFPVHGLPISITCDNGPQFISESFKTYMKETGTSHHHSTPLYPQANGEVERQNRSLLKRLKTAQVEGKNLKEELQTYLLMYRSTAHSVTGVSPAECLFGRNLRTKLPELSEYHMTDYEIRYHDSEKKEKGKLYTDKKRKAVESEIEKGDQVLVQKNRENKLSPNFHTEPIVVKEKKKNSVVKESNEGVRYKRNVTHLKKYNKRKSVNESNFSQSENESGQNVEKENNEKQNQCRSSSGDEILNSQSVPSEIPSIEGERGNQRTEMTTSRPVRARKAPDKLKDYIVY